MSDLYSLYDNINDLNPDKPFSNYELIANNTKILTAKCIGYTLSQIEDINKKMDMEDSMKESNQRLTTKNALNLYLVLLEIWNSFVAKLQNRSSHLGIMNPHI